VPQIPWHLTLKNRQRPAWAMYWTGKLISQIYLDIEYRIYYQYSYTINNLKIQKGKVRTEHLKKDPCMQGTCQEFRLWSSQDLHLMLYISQTGILWCAFNFYSMQVLVLFYNILHWKYVSIRCSTHHFPVPLLLKVFFVYYSIMVVRKLTEEVKLA
jgi:hypothetical protein